MKPRRAVPVNPGAATVSDQTSNLALPCPGPEAPHNEPPSVSMLWPNSALPANPPLRPPTHLKGNVISSWEPVALGWKGRKAGTPPRRHLDLYRAREAAGVVSLANNALQQPRVAHHVARQRSPPPSASFRPPQNAILLHSSSQNEGDRLALRHEGSANMSSASQRPNLRQ